MGYFMGVLFGSLNFKNPYHHYSIAMKTFLFENNKRKYIIKNSILDKYIVYNLDDNDDSLFTFNDQDTGLNINDIDKLVLVVSKVVEGRTNFTEEYISKELIERRREVELALQNINIG